MFAPDLTQIKKGDKIGVALSGGKDSVALLHYLFSEKDKLGITVCVINVEHGIRGESSLSDTAFCKDLAAFYGVKFYGFSVNSKTYAEENGLSLEEAARILRYESFFKCLNSGVCDKVAVAHHLSDSVETILLNLLRGSSLSGAKGISYSGYEGRIIRPFLTVDSQEVGLYVQKHQLSFVQDQTNFDETYTRNALRNAVIPKIKEIFPKFESSLSRFAELAESDDEYLYSLAEKSLKKRGDEYRFSVDLAYPVFSRCVILSMKNLGVKKDYEKIHADDVFSLTISITGKKITLPKNLVAVREHGEIVIKKGGSIAPSPVPFEIGETIFGDYKIVIERVESSSVNFGDGLYFDGDKLPYNAVIRTKEVGDVFEKFGGGTVSLKKYLTDEKFSQSKKNSTPVLACGNIVYCVCEKDVSSLVKIDKNTKNVIKLSVFILNRG
ncbi:MAG: tRNA lysidine(34) synthetase TilS [Clostridia bacterium]|nr:tRNA lysidine(34) synthetase TilS [Clostridia bacterium]